MNASDNLVSNLEEKYINKNKITAKEGNKLKSSFNKMITDVQNGGLTGSLYSYLKNEMPNLERENFYKKYHGIVNYLYKDFIRELSKNWNYY